MRNPLFRQARIRVKQRTMIAIQFVALPHFEGLALPSYETAHAAGMDLRAAVPEGEPLTLAPGARAMVPTGITMALPEGYEAQVRPRSGLAARHGVTCLNTPGTIDADYRGEVKVILINLGQEPFVIRRGERIAQMVIAPVTRAAWETVAALPDSTRGTGGFGSTGR
jgi:dUTP pyrophosphatase